MNIIFLTQGIRLGRDAGDKAISHESTVTHHIRAALNRLGGKGRWVRFYPHKHGLTDCRQGVRNTITGEIYWHERYQVEAAHKAFNDGSVYFQKA